MAQIRGALNSGLLLMLLAPVVASADPKAIKIPSEMMNTPEAQAMIREYNTIAARSPVCNDQKNFGLHVVKVDGVRQIRYYVDTNGIGCVPARLRPQELWRISREDWIPQDEVNFAKFVQALGNAVESGACRTVDTCMISSANILRNANDAAAFHYADCADFPFFLRSYFAFRNQIPFTYALKTYPRKLTAKDKETNDRIQGEINALQAKAASGRISQQELDQMKSLQKRIGLRNDPRYTPNGNWVRDRLWVLYDQSVEFFSWVRGFRDVVSTASMRMWRNGGEQVTTADGQPIPELEPDFYSPRLDPVGIRPGTVLYKTDGHTAIVYKVDQTTGKIFYIDAHPDNSISQGVVDESWTKNFSTRANFGGGFKNFRPIKFIQTYRGRLADQVKDHELPGLYSPEQYENFPNASSTVTYNENGFTAKVNYMDFLRLRMTRGRYRLDPSQQFKDDLKGLCKNIQYRREDVLIATSKGFHLTPHPSKLPDNIFGADGDWEKYSTPGRDVVFKQKILNVGETLSKYKSMIESQHPLLRQGLSVDVLKQEMLESLQEIGTSCKVSYTNSVGKTVSFNLLEAIERAPLMSFDPYHCPERRFGATSAEELSTCTDTPDKAQWYAYQQGLRNRTEKTPNESMGWSLEQLKSKNEKAVDSKLMKSLDLRRAIENL